MIGILLMTVKTLVNPGIHLLVNGEKQPQIISYTWPSNKKLIKLRYRFYLHGHGTLILKNHNMNKPSKTYQQHTFPSHPAYWKDSSAFHIVVVS
jgi:hypothetical protein